MSRRYQNLPFLAISLALLTYTTLRAYHLSLTHDECGSFAIWIDFDIFSCRTNPDCWGTANLHWLYVLLMKMTVGIFGDSELAIRLPALLGHVIYLWFSFRLSKWVGGKLEPSSLAASSRIPTLLLPVCGFLLLNCNPYLLDFHSLARGYGLAMAMMLASLYYLARWTETGGRWPLLGMFGSAALAVLSNFTLLVYFACLLTVVAVGVLWAFFTKDDNRRERAKWAMAGGGAFAVALWWLLHEPIRLLRERGEFEWGRETFYETYKSVVACSLYGGRYLKEYNLEVFGGLMFVLLMAALVLAVTRLRSRPKETGSRFNMAAVALPLLATLAALAQHWLLGTKFQADRTAIMFIPLGALVVFLFFANWWAATRSRWAVGLVSGLALFVVGHLLGVGQLRLTSEWGYDAETKHMMAYLDEKIPHGQKIKLGVNWLYHPSATYYQRRLGYDFTVPPVYSKELLLDGRYDYYYVQPDDVPSLEGLYEVEKRFSWVGVLLRKK